MGIKDILAREVWGGVSRFVPAQRWFSYSQQAKVWVSGYRVYRVPVDGTFWREPLIADFEQVRAVFVQWDAPYIHLDPKLIDQGNGQFALSIQDLDWSSTENGVLLLLITPLLDGATDAGEVAARDRVGFIRSIIVALLGRNAAFRREFEFKLDVATRTVASPTPAFTAPADDVPIVNRAGIGLANSAMEKTTSLDELTRNRVRLALRWYQRSLGDDRSVRDPREADVDDFIGCWLALETLAMDRTNDPNRITRKLADIHGQGRQRIGELFPIGRMYGLRGRIMHQGQVESLQSELLIFMRDIFVDLLLHLLGLPSGQNTRKYLDGSAAHLV